jgi:hypothetical protein
MHTNKPGIWEDSKLLLTYGFRSSAGPGREVMGRASVLLFLCHPERSAALGAKSKEPVEGPARSRRRADLTFP